MVMAVPCRFFFSSEASDTTSTDETPTLYVQIHSRLVALLGQLVSRLHVQFP